MGSVAKLENFVIPANAGISSGNDNLIVISGDACIRRHDIFSNFSSLI